jgi:hypothetical protein
MTQLEEGADHVDKGVVLEEIQARPGHILKRCVAQAVEPAKI